MLRKESGTIINFSLYPVKFRMCPSFLNLDICSLVRINEMDFAHICGLLQSYVTQALILCLVADISTGHVGFN